MPESDHFDVICKLSLQDQGALCELLLAALVMTTHQAFRTHRCNP